MEWPFLFIAAMFALNPITVSVYPAVSLAQHATFRITVMAPRHEDNRGLCLGVKLQGQLEPYQRLSCQSLDGANAIRTRTVYWTVESAGDYEAVATLTRIEHGNERKYVDQQFFRVVGAEP